ncbi:hypothetical protein GCM10007422_02380 [Pedobacter zeae]|nr:hypothetical protein GCM10007422_02380 [Pedobacter zeae]
MTGVPFYFQTAISGSPNNAYPKSVMSRRNGIIIDDWSPGSPEQMWQLNADGSISPWQTTSQVLTAQSTSPTSCVQITLEAYDGSQALSAAQIWTMQNNHFSVDMGGSIGTVYLNLYNADLSPGTMVITYETSDGDNEKWFLFPATDSQQASNNFYIQTGMSGEVNGQANPYVLSVNSDNAVVIEQLAPGSGSQIWTINPNGTITPIGNYQVVLTANSSGSGQVTLETFNSATQTPSPAQTWNYSNNQFWVDLDSPVVGIVYLNVDGGNQTSGAEVVTYEQTSGNNEIWYTIPASPIMMGEWFYLKTNMPNSAGDHSVYVMTVSDTNISAGTPVVIQPLNPGSPTQLWRMQGDGVIVNSLNPGLALASTPDDHNVTLEATGGSYWVQWFLMSNGMLATGSSGDNFYLNVQGGGNATAGQNLITYGFSTASNELWTALPYEPEGLYFTIRNAAYAQSGPMSNLLSLTPGGVATLAPPSGGLVTPTGYAALFQLWRKTTDGHILSATNPGMVLTATEGASSLTIAPLDPTNDKQLWTTNYSQLESIKGPLKKAVAGTIENLHYKQILCGNVLQNPPSSGSSYPNDALWAIVPHGMPFSEPTTIRNAGNGQAGLFLSLPDSYEKDGIYPVTVGAISSDADLTMWQYEYPGYMVSALDPGIVLSLEIDPSGTPQNPKYLNSVVTYMKDPGGKLFQLWTISDEGLIINQYNGKALTIAAASPGAAITTEGVSGDTATALQVWDFSPGKALQTVLAQPSWAYPTFTGSEATAYSDICSQLNQSDIRSQYINLAAPVGGFQSQISVILTGYASGHTALPAGTAIGDFISVAQQLSKEFTAVSAVQALFGQATTLYLSLSQAQSMTLSELITACELTTGISAKVTPPKKKNGWFGPLLEGVLYTVMNVAGTFVADPAAGTEASLFVKFMKNGLPCFANIMATGYSTYQGSQQTSSYVAYEAQKIQQDFYNYEMTVAQLQQMLLQEFEALGTALGNIETFILSDWGKTQAVYEMSNRIGDMSSLFWPSTMTARDVQQMLLPYTVEVLKTLLPANASYHISATMHTNYQNRQGEGWHNGNYFTENQDGTENMYSTNVSQQVMNQLWACGTKAISFYRGLNGWHLPYSYQDMLITGKSGVPAGASALVTVENFTNVELVLTLTLSSLVGEGSYFDYPFKYTPQTYNISAYRALQFAGASWVYHTDSNGEDTPYALAAPNLGPGITITDSQGGNVMNVEVFNTYQSWTPNTSIPAILSYKNQYNYAPYQTIINQTIAPDGMILVTITVTC